MKVTWTTSRDARLGIFRMECAHRTNKTISESSVHLGSAKSWQKMSSESFLGSVGAHYVRKTRLRDGECLDWTWFSAQCHSAGKVPEGTEGSGADTNLGSGRFRSEGSSADIGMRFRKVPRNHRQDTRKT